MIELDDRWGSSPAGSRFVWLEGRWPMNDPDVILPIDSNSSASADQPFVRQRLRPERIYLKRRHHAYRFNACAIFEPGRDIHLQQQYRQEAEVYQPGFPSHAFYLLASVRFQVRS